MTDLEKLLFDALVEAQGHLEYTGYGDSWERECARDSGMITRLTAAIEAGEKAQHA